VHFNSTQTDTTTLPVWLGESKIEPSQVRWLPGVTTIGNVHRPYPSGEQAIFFSGGNRIGKIHITDGDFSMVDEVSVPGLEDMTMSTTGIREISKQMQAANRDEEKYLPPFRKFLEKTGQRSATTGNGIYTMMEKDGYYYAGWGTSVYKVGDVRPGDVHSPIAIVESYDMRDGRPEDQRDKISRIFGFAVMYDGHLVIAMSGIIRALRNKEVQRMWGVVATHEFAMIEAEEAFKISATQRCGKILLYPMVFQTHEAVSDG
jgi:hypothetical protein